MKHEQRSNRALYHGGRPPGASQARQATNGIDPGSSYAGIASRGYAGLPGGKTEEVGLTLVAPARYRSLLVPLDGSAFGEHALPMALGIARRAGASVRLVHVHSPLESAWGPTASIPTAGWTFGSGSASRRTWTASCADWRR